jgi:hypothetical protein
MNYFTSPIGDNAEEEEGSFLSDLVIALVAFEGCMCLGLALSVWWPRTWWPL